MVCQGRLAELILHIANLLYFCGGVAVLVVGAIMVGSPSAVANMFSYVPDINQLENVMNIGAISLGPGIYMIVLGSLCIILCIIGCGGVFKKHKCIIFVYGLTTLLIMLFNVAVIMFYAIDPYFVQPTIEYQMNLTLVANYKGETISSGSVIVDNNVQSAAWSDMQFEQGCCGVVGYTDYQNFNSWNVGYSSVGVSNAVVPPSCCTGYLTNTIINTTTEFVNLTSCLSSAPYYTYTQGCSNYVVSQVTRYNLVYCVVAATITGLQAIILSMTVWSLVAHFDFGRV